MGFEENINEGVNLKDTIYVRDGVKEGKLSHGLLPRSLAWFASRSGNTYMRLMLQAWHVWLTPPECSRAGVERG